MGGSSVAVYCRFSVFKDGGSENVEDQESWGRAYAAESWPGVPVEVFVDDGITAARSDVLRPDFQRLREWIAQGRVAHLWCSEQSRLARTNGLWFSFAEELEAAGIDKIHTKHRGVMPLDDLGTEVEALVNTREVRKLRRRVMFKQDRLAEQGRPHGGTTFGYSHDVDPATGYKVLVVVLEQAEVLRAAAELVLSGVPPTRIAKDLAAQGWRGARGGEVGASTIKSWLTNPTVAGLRQHRGALVRGSDGELVRGTWEPILDMDTWLACRAKLAANARKAERPTRRKYLLSGIAVCECGRRMVGNWRARPRKGREAGSAAYLCKSCGCGIDAAAVDDYVSGLLLARLDVLAAALADNEVEARREEINRDLAAIEARRAVIGRLLGRLEMDEIGYKAAKAELDEQEANLTAALGELPTSTDVVDVKAVRNAWSGNTLNERQTVIAKLVERVVIDRARPGAPRKVDLGRVRIEGPGWES